MAVERFPSLISGGKGEAEYQICLAEEAEYQICLAEVTLVPDEHLGHWCD